jgi:Ala-tRNA(Pro) deacylase
VKEFAMPATKLKQYLDANRIRYVAIQHSPAYTAQEVAASAHIPGRELAKTVMVDLDGDLAMAVLPATKKLDLELLEKASGAHRAVLATERQFSNMFPDCEPGAMPPFGNLYDMEVYVDEQLSYDEMIAFNAGTHAELIQLSYHDFVRLVRPTVTPLAFEYAMH